jgi:3-oxoacyl-[acyl-carrier-protein] synthase II
MGFETGVSMQLKRVVVTGIGTVNPLGNDVHTFWEAIRAGKSGIGPNTKFDTEGIPSKVAGEVKDFDPTTFVERREARKMDNFTLFALKASIEAMADAKLTSDRLDVERFGVIVGNGIGGIETLEDAYIRLFKGGPRRIPVFTIPKLISNIGPGHIAIYFNAQGPCYAVVTACASGTDAIGDAARWIRDGFADVIITGGTEAAITKLGVGGFSVLQALSTKYNDTPEKASRPFDKDRDGFVLSEGAGILVLEELEHAKKRGAHIYCEYGGSGMTCDANHVTAPHPEGLGAIRAMKMALRNSGLEPTDIDYINAHGTSTPLNDPIETKAIKAVFGEHAYNMKVSSTKSMHGHCVAGGGGIEAIACVLAMRDQYFPPTINLDEPDPECDLDYVPSHGQEGEIEAAMSNSLGFGGHNGIVVLKRFVE